MDSELSILINSIKEKTGIDITIYAESMKYLVSTDPKAQAVLPSSRDFETVFADAACNRTFFKIKYKNARLIGMIDGVGETEKNYAFLIMNLIESSSNRELQLCSGNATVRRCRNICASSTCRRWNVMCWSFPIKNPKARKSSIY